ncbi:hypothetical protein SAMN05216232_3462 [Virgibacillus subterraneus]|uniref:TraB/GumN family protein n=1 Tax=Virgibacillus subterraneus TaxID=621109 RepID=A0A1H9JA55_9BACI|nr:DUF5694 domain-containing protein [Virgibacillus subterraneus]SEQ83740.1 hypothetical protein SAMN05216232_3462 [Virgibacillus subterraneus]
MGKPKIMILGTFHMRYTPDLYRIKVADLLNDNRQKEIRGVIEKIKMFNPTKLAFEVIKGEEEELNEEYKKYLNDEIKLKVDEVHQYGFRIASELNHPKVYAIDWMESVGNMGIGQVFDWAKTNQPELYDYIDKKYRSDRDFNLTDKSIVDLMRDSNNEANIRKGHEMNMAIARIGSEENYVGIDWLRWWYQRNLIIYSNLANISNSSSDRIILIIGHAHVYLISQFLKESGMFEVKSAMNYL